MHLGFVKGKRGPRETPVSPTLQEQLQNIEEVAAENDDVMVPIEVMQDLATRFCVVPPEEVAGDILLSKPPINE